MRIWNNFQQCIYTQCNQQTNFQLHPTLGFVHNRREFDSFEPFGACIHQGWHSHIHNLNFIQFGRPHLNNGNISHFQVSKQLKKTKYFRHTNFTDWTMWKPNSMAQIHKTLSISLAIRRKVMKTDTWWTFARASQQDSKQTRATVPSRSICQFNSNSIHFYRSQQNYVYGFVMLAAARKMLRKKTNLIILFFWPGHSIYVATAPVQKQWCLCAKAFMACIYYSKGFLSLFQLQIQTLFGSSIGVPWTAIGGCLVRWIGISQKSVQHGFRTVYYTL